MNTYKIYNKFYNKGHVKWLSCPYLLTVIINKRYQKSVKIKATYINLCTKYIILLFHLVSNGMKDICETLNFASTVYFKQQNFKRGTTYMLIVHLHDTIC